MRKFSILWLVGCTVFVQAYGQITIAFVEPPEETKNNKDECTYVPKSIRVSARYTGGKGIGYSKGYGTLEAFLSPPPDLLWATPFIDLRGHLFNGGRWAANGGIGVRKILKERIYCGYAYYDYRNTSKKNYNQVSFGIETIGSLWDLRFNGYVVLGKAESAGYDPVFKKFAGNSIYYTQKFQYALSGTNAEVGFHAFNIQNLTLYTAAGPYYLNGPLGTGVFGGQVRAKASWKEILNIELNYSYDHLYKNIIQGQIGLSFAFGPSYKTKKRKYHSCESHSPLYDYMIQPVMKNEIIPVATETQTKLAINPATGQPYTVWFVNNLSHCAGTFESPFATLLDAQNASNSHDIIYVHPGDLTSVGLSNGIVLKHGQQLLGATLNHDVMTTDGLITLAAQAQSPFYPTLSNTIGPVITTASDNTIAGFYIQNTAGSGISANNITNLYLIHNAIQSDTSNHVGIELNNVSGNVVVINSSILNQKNSIAIQNSAPISNASYLLAHNLMHTSGDDSNLIASFTEGTNNELALVNNIILSTGNPQKAPAIHITVSNNGSGEANRFTITRNNIQSQESHPFHIVLNKNANCHMLFANNNLNTQLDHAFSLFANDNSNSYIHIVNNSILFSNDYGVLIKSGSQSKSMLNINGNILDLPHSIDSNVLYYSTTKHACLGVISAKTMEKAPPPLPNSSSTAIHQDPRAQSESSHLPDQQGVTTTGNTPAILSNQDALKNEQSISIRVFNSQQKSDPSIFPPNLSHLPPDQTSKNYILLPFNTDSAPLKGDLRHILTRPIYKVFPIDTNENQK